MGRKQFESIVATASRKSFHSDKNSPGTIVPAGGTENLDIFSPSGSVGRVVSMTAIGYAPVGATSGTHLMNICPSSGGAAFTQGESNYIDDVNFGVNSWVTATSIARPSDESAVVTALQNVMFDDVTGFRFQYTNNTDVDQTGTRILNLNWIEEVVGK